MRNFDEAWGNLLGRQHHALHMEMWRAVGKSEGGLRKLLAGETTLTIEEVVRDFFDRHGVPIRQGLEQPTMDPNWSFRYKKFEPDFAACLFRLHLALGMGEPFMRPEELRSRYEAALGIVRDNERTKNALNMVSFPFALPRMDVEDYGQALEQLLLGVERSYLEQFPERKFHNYRRGELASYVAVVENSRHDVFLRTLSRGSVVGAYFPCLQGFSIPACLEVAQKLPECFLLAGALEPAAVQMMHPAEVARDFHFPGMDCAAVHWQGLSLYFTAYGDELSFDDRDLYAYDSCAGGLVVLG